LFDAADREPMAGRSPGEYDALALTAGLWFLVLFLRYVFPPLFPTFRAVYGLSNGELGALFTGLMVAYAAMQLPAGVLSDRFGRVTVIVAGMALGAVAAIGLAVWQTTAVLVGAMVLIGFGTGVHKTVAIPLLATIYPARTGRSLGIMDATGQLGGVLAPGAVVAVGSVAALAWPHIFLAGGALGVALVVALRLRIPDSRADATDTDAAAETAPLTAYLRPFADRRFAAFVVAASGVAFAWNGVSAFLVLFLADVHALSERTAGLLFAGLFVVGLAQPAIGAIGDRIGHRVAGLLAVATAIAGVGGLLVAPSFVSIVLAVALTGVGLHGFRPVRDAFLVEQFPDATAGGALGLVRTAIMGLGAIAPAVVGTLSETTGTVENPSYTVAFGAIVAVLLGCGVIVGAIVLTDDEVTSRP
jgi:MFS family permease